MKDINDPFKLYIYTSLRKKLKFNPDKLLGKSINPFWANDLPNYDSIRKNMVCETFVGYGRRRSVGKSINVLDSNHIQYPNGILINTCHVNL